MGRSTFFQIRKSLNNANDIKTIIIAVRIALYSKDFNYLRKHGGMAEDVLINIVKRKEDNELFLYFRREYIDIINLANQMNGLEIILEESAERIAQFLLPPLPHEVKVQSDGVKDVPDVDKSFQRSIDKSFITDGKVPRSSKR
jgi:hypothetical protein